MREEILKAAHEVFSTTAFRHATVRNIADRAGYSTGAIYMLWPQGKDALWREVTHQEPPDLISPQ